MTGLDQLASLIFDVIVNIDPSEFDAGSLRAVRTRFKTGGSSVPKELMNGGCQEFSFGR